MLFNLINELSQPGLSNEGTPVAVSTLKLRAANTIKSLYEQGQSDLQARLRLQAENASLASRLVELEGPPLEYCMSELELVRTQEYKDAFC